MSRKYLRQRAAIRRPIPLKEQEAGPITPGLTKQERQAMWNSTERMPWPEDYNPHEMDFEARRNNPARERVFAAFERGCSTNTEVSRLTGIKPLTCNYHAHWLERAGKLHVVEVRGRVNVYAVVASREASQ